MIEIRAYEPAAAPHVMSLWWRAIGERYPLREDVLAQCLERNPSYRPGDALVAWQGDRAAGFAFIGVHRLQDPETAARRGHAWLQAVVVDPADRRQGLGRSLVARLASVAEREGSSTVDAAGGFSYLWPGVPTDLPGATAFAEALGFEARGDTYDLRGNVADLHADEAAAGIVAAAGLMVEPATARDRDALLSFLVAEAWDEWWQDLRRFLDDGGLPADILLLREARGPGHAIRGMARIHRAGSRPVGPPLFWAARRAPAAGGLGPIGVAASLRGRGLGRALLAIALGQLRDLGLDDVVIDWTVLTGFYGPLGFSPWMTFREARAPTVRLLGSAT
jgi:GNAT superfamily N-acetyltransferase